jgi:hypothetical protein
MTTKGVVIVFAAAAVAGLIMAPAQTPATSDSTVSQLTQPTISQAPTTTPATTTPAKPALKKAIDPKAELVAIGKAKSLSDAKIEQIKSVIKCESGWNPKAIGDNGRSFGLVQIHLPAHPDISKAQALNPTFAINFIVDEFKRGNQWKWTCYKTLFT